MSALPRPLLAAGLALALSFVTTAQAQERFPAIPDSQLEDLLRNARCADTISGVALTAARTDSWRGFALRLCTPDNQPAGAIVAWYELAGQHRIVATLPDGRPLPMANQNFNDGHQQALTTVFAMQFGNRRAGCWFARSNWRSEPWNATFCSWLDANGQIIPRG